MDSITHPTWEKYTIMSSAVRNMNVRERRQLFVLSRHESVSPDTFFPSFGLTLSEFSLWYLVGDFSDRPNKKECKSIKKTLDGE